jgi:hypothetical protein
MTRNGKIARLSRNVREELNRRLRDGEQGKRLVTWLNSQPEIQSMLAREFGGRSISQQNLSEWKQGGYCEWLAHQDALERARNMAADAGELTVAAGALADHLAIVLTARYAAALTQWDASPNGTLAQNIRTLRALCQDIVELRRGDHSAARLKVEQERLELERSKDEEDIQERIEKWLQRPDVEKRIFGRTLSPEEREKRFRGIFGRASKTAAPKRGLSPEGLRMIEKAAKVLS